MTDVFIKRIETLPPPVIAEAIRYAGARAGDDSSETLLFSCIEEGAGCVRPSVCYVETDVNIDAETVCLGEMRVCSRTLSRTLCGCERAVIFVATVGAAADRLIARYSRISPSRALMLDAFFSERVERVCDAFEEYLRTENETGVRVSAGYGDIPIELQREIFLRLCPERRIGVSLTDSLLMTPTKSVSAIIGIRR